MYHIDQLSGDPGDFHRIKIELSNGKALDEINVNGWIKKRRGFPQINEIESDYVTIGLFRGKSIVICNGYNYASDPGLISMWDFYQGD